MIRLFLTVLATAVVSSTASAQLVRLDAFLSGFGDNCRPSAAYAAFKTSIQATVSFSEQDVFEVAAPAAVRPAFAYPASSEAEPETGSVLVHIPLKNAWYMGLRVNALGMRLARKYRWVDDIIYFDEPPAVVRQQLARLLASADEAILGPGMYEYDVLEDFIRDGRPAFRCMTTK